MSISNKPDSVYEFISYGELAGSLESFEYIAPCQTLHKIIKYLALRPTMRCKQCMALGRFAYSLAHNVASSWRCDNGHEWHLVVTIRNWEDASHGHVLR